MSENRLQNSHSGLSRRGFLGAAAGVAGVAALSLAGCAPTGNSTSPTSTRKLENKPLVLMSLGGEVPNSVLNEWKKIHPEIPITLINSDQTRLNAMVAAGNPPDIVRDYGVTSTPYIASKGLALNLDPWVADSHILNKSNLAAINDVWKWDGEKQGSGHRYGITKDYSEDLMFWYNKDILPDAGYAIPTAENPYTYDHLLEIAKPLTKTSRGKIDQYGLFNTIPDTAHLSAMMATADTPLFNEKLTKVDFSSPEGRRALKWFVDVAKAGVGPTIVNPSASGWDWPTFANGTSTMCSQGYWLTGTIPSVPGAEKFARLSPAPIMGKTRFSPSLAATGYWISAKTQVPNEAFAFLEWYLAGAPAVKRTQLGSGLPTVNSLTKYLPSSKPYAKQSLDAAQTELSNLRTLAFSPYAQVTALDAAVAALFPNAVNGGLSIGKLADQANTALNALLANGVVLAGK